MMKLTFLFILLACLQVSARTYSQDRITVNIQSADLKKALTIIEKKSNYHFLYNEAIIANKPKIDLNVKDADIRTILEKILTANGIHYRILNNNLIVLKAQGDVSAEVQDIRVTGKVSGLNGEPLQGVSVSIKGTNTGTTTDAEGNFALTVPDENSVLVFSYVGYATQELTVGTRTSFDVSMQGSSSQLDNIVVVGYGTQRKIDVTGSVAQIKGDEVAKQPAANPLASLQGKVSGVQIINSGAPGASPDVRIRGVGSIRGNPSPLYVVDGVWYNDISFLNPNDIENMSILKDASSQAIYGVRAANGVILITTKKGRSGTTNVNYNGFVGVQSVTNVVEMANANEYATLVNELRAINGGSGQLLDPTQFTDGTDWYGQILRNALVTNHQVSVSGGSERSTYNFSLGYFKQEGIVETNDYTRYTARLQNDFQAFKPLKLGYSVTGAYSYSNDIPGGIFHELFAAAPVVPVYYADGTYGDPSDYNLGDGNNFNPQVTLDYFNQKSKNYRLTGNVFGELKFARDFTFRSSLGGDFGQAELRNYLPVYVATLKQRNTTSRLNVGRTETRNWILENTLTYDKRLNDHIFKVLLGQGAQRYQSYGLNASARNVPNSSIGDHYLTLGDDVSRIIDDFGDVSTFASYFARVNYSFLNRYLVNASVRADGSSKFYGDDRWGYFPSIGLGWVISDENFMQGQDVFNNLKLRGSWGKIGNGNVPSSIPVQRLTQYPPAFFGPGGGTPYTTFSVASIVPQSLGWEKGVGTDIGLEASLMNNKLYLEAAWYNRKTENAIFAIPILISLGLGGSLEGNQAEIENRGFEFLATWKDDVSRDFSYSISGNLSLNNNKVLSVTTGANPIYGGGGAATGGQLATRTMVGRPIGEFYGLEVAGVFQSATEIAGSPQSSSAKPGDFRYVDQNKDGIIDAKDNVPLGDPNAGLFYGLNTNWNYKNFDLTVDLQGVANVDVYNANLGIRFGNENFSKDFYDNRWHGAGTSNEYPSANIGGGLNYLPNSFFVEDGSYLRIRNLQLGYTLPRGTADRWKMKSLRIFVNAQNAFNFFQYKGFSPEINGGSPIDRGIDTNVYPLYATYNFGVNVNF